MNKAKSFDTQKLVLLAMLTAIVFILQFIAIATRTVFPVFAISLVLIPIVIGAALIGVYAGLWLGLVFGTAVLLSGDAAAFLIVDPFATILVVLVKGSLAGLAAGIVYRLLFKKNKTVAVTISAIICPVINTGIFLIGVYIFFLPTISEWGLANGFVNATEYIFISLIGVNFLFELGLNLVLSPVIVRLLQYRQNQKLL